jgi:histidine ammonia-lyase
LVRAEVPPLTDDRYFHPEIEWAAAMVRTGAVLAPARHLLPAVA